jgi:hypothetical protein
VALAATTLLATSGAVLASAGNASAAVTPSAVTASGIAQLAQNNVGDMACSADSLGGKGYGSSCTGNGGQPEYWCADFAKWVWQNSGVTDLYGLTPAARSFYTYGQSNGTLTSTPAVGDAVVFSNAAGDTSSDGNGIHHVAIVSQVNSDGTINTVSGDWGGQSGSESTFAGSSHVVANPAYNGTVGTHSSVMGMWIEGYIPPPGVTQAATYDTDLTQFQSSGQVVAAPDLDGRLEMFAGGPDGVWHRWQTAVNGGWSSWVLMAGSLDNARLGIGRDADGRLELFTVNADHMLMTYQTAANDGWSDWVTTGTGGGTDIVVEPNADGRLEVMLAGHDQVWDMYQQQPGGDWTDWAGVGGPTNAHLAVGRDLDGRLELFAINGSVTQMRYQTGANDGWTGWQDFAQGGTDIAVGSDQDGRMEVFFAGNDQVWQKYQQQPGGDWSDWMPVAGPAGAQISVALDADGRLEVVASNATQTELYYQTVVNGGWSNWVDMGGSVFGNDSNIAQDADGRLEVYVTGSDQVYAKWEQTTEGDWTDFTGTGGPATPYTPNGL